jgi:hypothetical protein
MSVWAADSGQLETVLGGGGEIRQHGVCRWVLAAERLHVCVGGG